MAELVQAQQTPSPASTITDLYRPFAAPPGERTRADAAWPAANLGALALPAPIPGIGRPATSAEIAGWDIAVRGDGHNLPPGSGTARQGEELYVTHCAACHGDFGEGLDRWPALMGGRGSLRSDQPKRTVGSFWQHAPSVFDYIRRAMPYAAPQSLTNDEYYAITAYVLFLNELIGEDDKMDATRLPKIAMPNRDGFVLEARPDTEDNACMSNCRQGRRVNVTMDSRRFVEPGSGSGTDKPE
ncbi:MAG: cytochrome c [Roseomonas sp.]|nr:cytochrome c [Roseomonas sp.]MCA3328975.1 cytochrome c [Roseomonas sp.]MCA3332031.1 cytochrome c [Roseomonas sp.]MCA3334679.1 cytochrome c [Roseomonas sp.]MCA3346930.1 cytochrome c [Roseomonas sp.]